MDNEIFVFSEKVIGKEINDYFINAIYPKIKDLDTEDGQRIFFKELEERDFRMSDFLLYLTTEKTLKKEIPENGILKADFNELVNTAYSPDKGDYAAMRETTVYKYPVALYILKVFFKLGGIDEYFKPLKTKIYPYPKSNDIVKIPTYKSFMMNTSDIYSSNGELIKIDDAQYRLISALKIDLTNHRKHDKVNPLIVPLRNIAIYVKGGDGTTEPTAAELARVDNMLEFFNMVQAFKKGDNGELYRFQFVHFDTVENVTINGQLIPKAYIIYNVLNIPNEFEIEYRQFKLPKGYTTDIENYTLWAAITDKTRADSNKTIDFENICVKLGVSRKNAVKRRILIEKLQDMAKCYGYDDIKIQRIKYNKTVTKLLLAIDD